MTDRDGPTTKENRAQVQTVLAAGLGVAVVILMQAVEKGPVSNWMAAAAAFAGMAVAPLCLAYLMMDVHNEELTHRPHRSVVLLYAGMACVFGALLAAVGFVSVVGFWLAVVSFIVTGIYNFGPETGFDRRLQSIQSGDTEADQRTDSSSEQTSSVSDLGSDRAGL